jgi:hypothetical protein
MCAVAVKEEDFAVGQWGSEGKASNAASDSSSPLMSSFLSLTHHVMGGLSPPAHKPRQAHKQAQACINSLPAHCYPYSMHSSPPRRLLHHT